MSALQASNIAIVENENSTVHKISFLFSSNTKEEIIIKNYYDTFYNHIFWSRLGILLFVTTDIYVIINDRHPIMWFLICFAEGLIGVIYMNGKKI